jgi:hypothetical protein
MIVLFDSILVHFKEEGLWLAFMFMSSSSAVKSSVVGTTNLFSESVDTGHVLKWSLISVYGKCRFPTGGALQKTNQ